MSKPKLVVILGPTASGKSALAVNLAKKFNGEIISADSRQVYRGLNIGTGKVPISYARPNRASTKSSILTKVRIPQYKGILHHLLDVASPKKVFTVAQYQKLANQAIKQILARKHLPIICGGTGLYIDTVLYNYALPAVPPNPKLRRELEAKTTAELFAMLKKLDPRRAQTIDPKNPRRLIRALEIVFTTGAPVPPLHSPIRTNESYEVLKIGLRLPNSELKRRIHHRFHAWLEQGLLTEITKLHKQGVSWQRFEEFGLEYKYASQYLRGLISKEQMIQASEKELWRYAKRQMTWFKRDKKTRWVKNLSEAERLTKAFLS